MRLGHDSESESPAALSPAASPMAPNQAMGDLAQRAPVTPEQKMRMPAWVLPAKDPVPVEISRRALLFEEDLRPIGTVKVARVAPGYGAFDMNMPIYGMRRDGRTTQVLMDACDTDAGPAWVNADVRNIHIQDMNSGVLDTVEGPNGLAVLAPSYQDGRRVPGFTVLGASDGAEPNGFCKRICTSKDDAIKEMKAMAGIPEPDRTNESREERGERKMEDAVNVQLDLLGRLHKGELVHPDELRHAMEMLMQARVAQVRHPKTRQD